MSTLSLYAGAAAFLAGLLKYGLDAYKAKHNTANVVLSIGDQSIQVPSSYTSEQVAALVTVLKDNLTPKPSSQNPT